MYVGIIFIACLLLFNITFMKRAQFYKENLFLHNKAQTYDNLNTVITSEKK
jgi:hypothetical protein